MTLFGWKKRCRQLQQENQQLRERNSQLQAHNTQLQAALAAAQKNSGNCSKPPSSDIVKPPRGKPGPAKGKGRKRRIGAQKGHPKHERSPFTPDQINQTIAYHLGACPIDPSHRIIPAAHRQRILQQIELRPQPFWITQRVAYGIWCEDCGCYHDAPFPEEVRAAGLFGPRLTALSVYLKGKLHGSYSGIRDFFWDVAGVKVSRGYVAKLLAKSANAFGQPVEELLHLLPQQSHLNVDETGHKDNGQRQWTWCFRAGHFVFFKIEPSRGSEVLRGILGEGFQGILGCDYYAAYRKYARQCHVLIQFCLAHLIGEIKYLCEFPDSTVQRYGQSVLAGLKALFGTLHRKERLSDQRFTCQLEAAREQILEAALQPMAAAKRLGQQPHRLIQNMVSRFSKHGEAYFQFVTHPEIQPTNNAGEQAIRFIVMDRHMTQGTRSWRGRRFCERLWTVMGTCALQKRSAFDWMCRTLKAHFQGRPPPSLLLDSS